MTGKRTFLSLSAIVLALALPGAALAVDSYVDQQTGDDADPCGPMNDPCATVPKGISVAGAGDTIHVDDTAGQYTSMIMLTALSNNKSLLGDDFVGGDEQPMLPEPDTILAGQAGVFFFPALSVSGAAGTIQNLRIRDGSTYPLQLDANATLTGNVIEADDLTTAGCLVRVANAGNTSTIGPNNVFGDLTPGGTWPHGVCVVTDAAPTIAGNSFTNMDVGVQNSGGNSTIEDNLFDLIRGTSANAAIEVNSGTVSIYENQIINPGNDQVAGIRLEQLGAPVVGAFTRRNVILEYRIGLIVNDTDSTVELQGDLIAGSVLAGIASNDGGNDGDTKYSVTNATISDNGTQEISVNDSELTLDSSIVGPLGINTMGAGATCTITFSRGPVMAPGGTGCGSFATTAPPGFVNPAALNYHLAAGSAMIDMGNPAAPSGSNSVDLDGDPRALAGLFTCAPDVVRRDIGADEFVNTGPRPPCTPASKPKVKKKCKKRKKKRSAAAAKKRCKRKKK
jgi:hypothetical protein